MHQIIGDLYTKYFVDLGDYRKTVLLAGVGRSGTTWVGDLINYRNSYRAMFEPFHAKKIDMLSHFSHFQYLRPENRDSVYFEPIKAVLSGRVRHEWVDRFNRKLVVRRRLIKDIRANLMLKWIKTNFADIPILLLLRHPCAVASSRMKLGWEPNPVKLLEQENLTEDFLAPFRSIIESTTDTFEKYILAWCIQYLVPLKQFSKGEILVLFYESLCVQPEAEMKRVFDFIHEPFLPSIADVIHKPSALARKQSAIVSGGDLVRSWQREITNEQAKRAAEILCTFGLDQIYDTGPMPLIDSESVFERS